MLTPTSGFLRIPLLESQYRKEAPVVAIPSEERALTPTEQVILKDTWNKFCAWSTVGMEALVNKMYQEDPSLETLLLPLGHEVEDILFGFFDVWIRSLQPHTESLGREAVKPFRHSPWIRDPSPQGYALWFATLGLLPRHWDVIRRVWIWAIAQNHILEDLEIQNIHKGTSSAFFRFFSQQILPSVLSAIQRYQDALSPLSVKKLCQQWLQLQQTRPQVTEVWKSQLLQTSERWAQWFAAHPCDFFSDLGLALDDLFANLHEPERYRWSLQIWGQTFREQNIPSCLYSSLTAPLLASIQSEIPEEMLSVDGWKLVLQRAWLWLGMAMRYEERLLQKAQEWLDVMRDEQGWSEEKYTTRMQEIAADIRQTDIYTHTSEELEYGAKVAWRNTAKCIGRIHWDNLMVRDCRHVNHPDAMFAEVLEHLRIATSGGNVQIVMTVFPPQSAPNRPQDINQAQPPERPQDHWGPRFWNTQYIRYAAYEQPDGSIVGDPVNLRYTQKLQSMGWQPPNPPGEFDRLPLVLQVPGYPPKMYELPPESVLEVPLEHPHYPEFSRLGLRWCAIPAICNIGLDLGGIRYTCTPFNGWFMGTEIARDLFDSHRYNKAEWIARWLNFDMSSEQNLWRDRAFLELNYAILHSFQKHQVTLVDHHTASRQFLVHDRREKQAGRECPARWSWIVPPMSGSVCEVFHHEMREFVLVPQYRDMSTRWEVEDGDCALLLRGQEQQVERSRVLILFGSESGTAENFAIQAARRLRLLKPEVKALDDSDPADFAHVDLLLVITSTFGQGELPHNARKFAAWLEQQPADFLEGTHFGVLGIGSSLYENFCAGGIYLNQLLRTKGGHCLLPLHKGDERKGQAKRFQTWVDRIARVYQVGNRGVLHREKIAITWLEREPSSMVSEGTGSWLPIQQNQELIGGKKSALRSTRCIVLDNTVTKLPYQAGDHLGVYPVHSMSLVEALCTQLQVDPDAWFTTASDTVGFAVPTTPRQVFAQELDLSLQYDVQPLLRAICQAATDETEQQQLDMLLAEQMKHTAPVSGSSDEQNHPHVANGLSRQYLHVLDLLRAYPSVQLSFAECLALLPRQKPRYYSIASSSQHRPQDIQITVSVLHTSMSTGQMRPGLCSNYLAHQNPGERVRVFVRPSTFRVPEHPTDPLFLVGPGTGISPLLGFLEERQHTLEQSLSSTNRTGTVMGLGPAWLFFGCRNTRDFLYQKQLALWLAMGVLSRMDVAFSRRFSQKQYVQDLIMQQSRDVWNYLSHPRCHLYVCGATQMARDVHQTLLSVAGQEGNLWVSDATAFFENMKAEGRYLTDVWGG